MRERDLAPVHRMPGSTRAMILYSTVLHTGALRWVRSFLPQRGSSSHSPNTNHWRSTVLLCRSHKRWMFLKDRQAWPSALLVPCVVACAIRALPLSLRRREPLTCAREKR